MISTRRQVDVCRARAARARVWPSVLWLVCSVGCGDDSGTEQDGSTVDVDAEVVAKCAEDTPEFVATRDEGTIAVGMHGAVQARVVAADPAMPERFENDWTVLFTDTSGSALEDVEIIDACAFMPTHAHGGAPRAVEEGAEAGSFDLVGLNLFMRGPWEVQLAVESAAADPSNQEFTDCDRNLRRPGSDVVTFRVCVPDD